MADRFRRHPSARLFGPGGTDAGTEALAQALTQGCGFRIGLPDEPSPAPEGFETLTSGSTGRPRRIRRSVASWTVSFAVNEGLFGVGEGTRVAVLGALEHSLSLYGALEGAHLGAEVHLLAGLRPDRQATALADRGVEVLYATPAQLRGLAGALPDLRLVPVGGSKLDGALRRRLAQIAPAAKIREFYGAAETSFVALADDDTPDDSVGRPYPGVSLDLRDGEVWVRSPYLFNGIRQRSGLAPVGRTAGFRWARSGACEDGFPVPAWPQAGRMVTVADQNVFPEEIEALMETLPGVDRAAVSGRAGCRAGPCAARRGDGRSGRRGGDPGRPARGPWPAEGAARHHLAPRLADDRQRARPTLRRWSAADDRAILAARRTAVVPRGGAFAGLRIEDLAAPVIAAVLADAGLVAGQVDEVILCQCAGRGRQSGAAGGAGGGSARTGGGPDHRPAMRRRAGCDRAGGGAGCLSGRARVVMAGGVESYSRRPLRLAHADPGRTGRRRSTIRRPSPPGPTATPTWPQAADGAGCDAGHLAGPG
jgi:long-chain acyl-CoA synthetase